jgi:Mg2+ and Co2+ transporter CorA
MHESLDRTVLPKSSWVTITDDPPAEADCADSGLEMVSGTTTQSQGQSKEGDLEHHQQQQKDATEQISTNKSESSLPKFSKSDIELVLDNAELLSLYYDPKKDEYQHEMRDQLDKDRDFDIVDSLLNDPGYLKTEDSFVPRVDVFLVDLSKGETPCSEEGCSCNGRIIDAAMNAVHRVLCDAFQTPVRFSSIPGVRLEKVFGHTIGSMLNGRTCSSYQVASYECQITWSHCARTRQTVGFLAHRPPANNLHMRNCIVQYLTEHRSWIAYPMLLALAVQNALATKYDDLLNGFCDRICRLELRTGYGTQKKDTSRLFTSDKESDPATQTAEATVLAAELAMNQSCWHGLQTLAHHGLRETQVLLQDLKDTDQPRSRSDLSYIMDIFAHSSSKYAARLAEAASVQSRASIQVQGLFNTIAQREQELGRQLTKASLQLGEATRQIAEDSKRDSTSMKAIAAVTMFFLPGTFVASLFAMPIFSWNATTGDDVISHRIWVYWAVTIPLTLITFGCFLLWDHLMNKPRYPSMESLQASVVSHQSLIPSNISPDPPKSSSTPEKK